MPWRARRDKATRAGPRLSDAAEATLQPSEPTVGRRPLPPAESGKFERLAEICEEIASRQERALIFTQFREITDPLAGFLAKVFGRPGLVLHGGTAVRRRASRSSTSSSATAGRPSLCCR